MGTQWPPQVLFSTYGTSEDWQDLQWHRGDVTVMQLSLKQNTLLSCPNTDCKPTMNSSCIFFPNIAVWHKQLYITFGICVLTTVHCDHQAVTHQCDACHVKAAQIILSWYSWDAFFCWSFYVLNRHVTCCGGSDLYAWCLSLTVEGDHKFSTSSPAGCHCRRPLLWAVWLWHPARWRPQTLAAG